MKVAIVGSRCLTVEHLADYLPEQVTEIISGGAKGIDFCAKEYARTNHLLYTESLPDYARYRRGAPIKRNVQIVDNADMVIAFWDGKTKGTKYTIEYCKKTGKQIRVVLLTDR